MDNKVIGKHLQNRRKKLNITQLQLAELLGVTHQAVSRWETGESIPDIQTLVDLAKLYNITIDEIINPEQIKTEVVKETKPVTEEKNDYPMLFSINVILNVLGLLFTFLMISRIDYWRLVFLVVSLIFVTSGIIIDIVAYNNFEKNLENKKRHLKAIMLASNLLVILWMYFVVIYFSQLLLIIPILLFYYFIIYTYTRRKLIGKKYEYEFKPIDISIAFVLLITFLSFISFYGEVEYYISRINMYGNSFLTDLVFDPHIMYLYTLILFAVAFVIIYINLRRKILIIPFITSVVLFGLHVLFSVLENEVLPDLGAIVYQDGFGSIFALFIFMLIILHAVLLFVGKIQKKLDSYDVIYLLLFILFLLITVSSGLAFYENRRDYVDGSIYDKYYLVFQSANFFWFYLMTMLPGFTIGILINKRFKESLI